MKRSRSREQESQAFQMADSSISSSNSPESPKASDPRRRVFVCKTCNREFSSFQALGGHRASHRKPRLAAGDLPQNIQSLKQSKGHECSICGLEFPVGQALGGHMRRHRNTAPMIHVERVEAPSDVEYDGGNGGVWLDLNLTPVENDLIRLQLMAPTVDCFT